MIWFFFEVFFLSKWHGIKGWVELRKNTTEVPVLRVGLQFAICPSTQKDGTISYCTLNQKINWSFC